MSALGKPVLRGSTIMPPLRHLRQEEKTGEQVWQEAAEEEAKEVRVDEECPDSSSGQLKQTEVAGYLSASRKRARTRAHQEHIFPGALGLSFEISRLPEPTKQRLLPHPTSKGGNLNKNGCQNLPRSMQNHLKALQGTTLGLQTSSSSETMHDAGFPVVSLEGLGVIYDSTTRASGASG